MKVSSLLKHLVVYTHQHHHTVFHCISLSLPPPQVYYVAEGVRLYSQETWRVVTQTRGVQLVEQYIHKVVSGVMGFLHAVKSLAIKV